MLEPTADALVQQARRLVPRCLSPAEREALFLETASLPRWCITGAGLEAETNAGKWQPKWPYHIDNWRKWLLAGDRGERLPMPPTE